MNALRRVSALAPRVAARAQYVQPTLGSSKLMFKQKIEPQNGIGGERHRASALVRQSYVGSGTKNPFQIRVPSGKATLVGLFFWLLLFVRPNSPGPITIRAPGAQCCVQ